MDFRKTFSIALACLFISSGVFADEAERRDMQQGTSPGGKAQRESAGGYSQQKPKESTGAATSSQSPGRQSLQPMAMEVVTLDVTNLHSADQLIGTQVRDKSGTEVGKIKDLMVNMQGERISYAVVSGKDNTTYFVPLSALTSSHQGKFVTLKTDKNTASKAPQPRSGMSEQEYGKQLHEHYGMSHPWGDLPGDVPATEKAVPDSNLTYPGPREVQPSKKEQTR